MIKCSTFCNGVTQLSRLSGQEYPGLILLTMISINGLMSTVSKEKEFRLLLNNSLVLYKSLMVNRINQNELSYLEKRLKIFNQFQNDYWSVTDHERKCWFEINKISFFTSCNLLCQRIQRSS